MILWESAEARLQAAHERVLQRANEGQSVPRSMGVPRAGARRPQSLGEPTPELAFLRTQGRLEARKTPLPKEPSRSLDGGVFRQ